MNTVPIFFLYLEYAQVTKMLGNGRLEAMCFDGVKRLCHIRGKLRKKVWINQADIVLIGLREYQDTKADVILKYTPDEARNLKTYGEFPETAKPRHQRLFNLLGELPGMFAELRARISGLGWFVRRERYRL
ncbi:PREDICTED: eukaryotic translation initiation factor 1A, X-chromosomal-like [Diuraphis noxia]|uniref:eukaryotic translation initiation factor 1A, X-chromosomal-like n=1 Tax=Diuraphis noxia TaxID=143948 RepID=UPI0007638DC0|nr:PREDICTED: eukaryotic translation initiation factor 1A, X-chromosomal-like [Diuraphis noxia]